MKETTTLIGTGAPPAACSHCGAFARRCEEDRDDGRTYCAMTGQVAVRNASALVLFGIGAEQVDIHYRPGRPGDRFRVVSQADVVAGRGAGHPTRVPPEAALEIESTLSCLLDRGGTVTITGPFPFGSTAAITVPVLAMVRGLDTSRTIVVGDVRPNGVLRAVRGTVPILLAASRYGITRAIVAGETNADGLTFVRATTGMDIRWAGHFDEVEADLSGGPECPVVTEPVPSDVQPDPVPAGLRGLFDRLVTMGSVLLVGPPGSGKTMLARRLMTDCPAESMRDMMAAYSAAGLNPPRTGPFRAPHHTASEVGMLGREGRPGEVTLAHGGVLFLDELPEWPIRVIESVGAALRAGKVTHRFGGVCVDLPARPVRVVATANDCPCGYYGLRNRACRCGAAQIEHYRRRIERAAAALGITETVTVPPPRSASPRR